MQAANEPVNSAVLSDSQASDTWNQQRTSDQLKNFIDRAHAQHDSFADIELALS